MEMRRPPARDGADPFTRLFEIANIRKPDGTPKRCHGHMFAHAFAVELLKQRRTDRPRVTVASGIAASK